jgi:hypothetical protein
VTIQEGFVAPMCSQVAKHYAMKAYGGSGCIDRHFLDLGTSSRWWSASRPGRPPPSRGKRRPSTYWIGGWVGPGAGLDDVEKRKFFTLLGFELRPPWSSSP